MKMKKYIKTIFVLSFAALAFILPCQKAKATSVETQKKWSTKKSIVYTKKGIQYYSYISKNKKECWIYKIKLKSKKVTQLNFPETIKGKKVTTIGAIQSLYPNDEDACFNIMGEVFEPWHGVEAESSNKIQTITVPETVKKLAKDTLAGFKKAKKITISSRITSLEAYQFYGDKQLKTIYIGGDCREISYNSFGRCKNLKTIKFGKKVKTVDSEAFTDCYKLKTINVNKKNKYLFTQNGLLLTKDKKKLLIVPCGKKKVKIPEGVTEIADKIMYAAKVKEIWIPKSLKKIGDYAFDMTDLKKWHIASGSVMAKTKSCVYSKETGELIYLFYSKSPVKLPEGVTRIGLPFSMETRASSIDILYLPKTFKEIDSYGWRGAICKHLYFTSQEPPKVISDYKLFEGWSVAPYIPAGNEEKYLNWLEEYFGFDREKDDYETF